MRASWVCNCWLLARQSVRASTGACNAPPLPFCLKEDFFMWIGADPSDEVATVNATGQK